MREIAAIAARPHAVRFEEIANIVAQLQRLGFPVSCREVRHGTLFRVYRRMFQITKHNRGSSQIRAFYVREFLKAMTDLELYEVNHE